MRLEIHDLVLSYPHGPRVLSDVNLAAADGEWVALVGANGSGKTTLLRAASGFLDPSAGAVTYDGQAIRSFGPRALARCRASLEQEPRLDLGFGVQEVVAMGRIPHQRPFGRETTVDRRAIEEAMAHTDIVRLAARPIHALSGGERQRVFLAMALAQEPGVLLLDEPIAHLDLRYQVELMEILRSRVDAGLTVLSSLHDLALAAAFADRVAILQAGRVFADGAPHDVLSESSIQRAFGVRVRILREDVSGNLTVLPCRKSSGPIR